MGENRMSIARKPIAGLGEIHVVAERVASRLMALLKHGRLERINIDIIRAACEVAAHYELLTAQELVALEESVLRRVVEKVG